MSCFIISSNCRLPADAAGGVEEPVHEYSSTVVVWVVGQQTVPLVLLEGGVRGAGGDGEGGQVRLGFTCSQAQSLEHLPVEEFLKSKSRR